MGGGTSARRRTRRAHDRSRSRAFARQRRGARRLARPRAGRLRGATASRTFSPIAPISSRCSRYAAAAARSTVGNPRKPGRSAGGKYVPPKNGSPCGVRKTVSGQPPGTPIAWAALMYTESTSGRSSRSTLMLTKSCVHEGRDLRRSRTTRGPSRGTSDTRCTRSTAAPGGRRSARARTRRLPTDTSRPGCPRAAAGTDWTRRRGDWPCGHATGSALRGVRAFSRSGGAGPTGSCRAAPRRKPPM